MYKIEFYFPSGKVELLEESYESLEEAIEGGNRMIVQVNANEGFYNYEDDSIGNSRKEKPHFFVLRIVGKDKEEVYDSTKF